MVGGWLFIPLSHYTGIRLAQKIVDAPTNEMYTDDFIKVYVIYDYIIVT